MMNANHDLDHLIRELTARTAPPLPGNFEQRVWREIRQRRDVRHGFAISVWFNRFFSNVLQPQTIAAALCVSLLLGSAIGFTISDRDHTRHGVQLGAFTDMTTDTLGISIK